MPLPEDCKNSVELFRSYDDQDLKASLPQRNTTLFTTVPKHSTKDDFLPLCLTFQASCHKGDPIHEGSSEPHDAVPPAEDEGLVYDYEEDFERRHYTSPRSTSSALPPQTTRLAARSLGVRPGQSSLADPLSELRYSSLQADP